jgi:hypothetical protein
VSSTGPVLTKKTYDIAKRLVQFGLPFTASISFGLSKFFDSAVFENVVGGAALAALFFGTALRTSSANYYNSTAAYDGEMVVIADGGGVRTFSLDVNGDPDDLALKSVISFKVRKTSVPEPPM